MIDKPREPTIIQKHWGGHPFPLASILRGVLGAVYYFGVDNIIVFPS
jgi:hypothetical protein